MTLEIVTPFYGCSAELSLAAARVLLSQLQAAIQSELLQNDEGINDGQNRF